MSTPPERESELRKLLDEHANLVWDMVEAKVATSLTAHALGRPLQSLSKMENDKWRQLGLHQEKVVQWVRDLIKEAQT